jgi:hypothetical protein
MILLLFHRMNFINYEGGLFLVCINNFPKYSPIIQWQISSKTQQQTKIENHLQLHSKKYNLQWSTLIAIMENKILQNS